ncbi:MAG: hypothetical protein ABWZ40_08295 [Caulobacterales bacterium]
MEQAQRAKLERRLTRQERSISFWLTRLAAFLSVFENGLSQIWRGHIERWLNNAAGWVVDVIMLRAARTSAYQKRAALRKETGCGAAWQHTVPRATVRALLGSYIRHALKARTLKGRTEKLLRLLKMRDAAVARMARRLVRGLTRFYSMHTRVVAISALAHSAALNSSAAQKVFGAELRADTS